MEHDGGAELQVLAADGGELAASITAASLALADSGILFVVALTGQCLLLLILLGLIYALNSRCGAHRTCERMLHYLGG